MNATKKSARITGTIFILATVASIASSPLLTSINASKYLTDVSLHETQIIFGVLLLFLSAVFSVSISISLYPVLRKYNEGLALGAVSFRIIEGVFYIIGAICLILLLALSQEFVKAKAPASSYFQTLGVVLLTGYHWANFVFGVMSFCLGALMYYYIFYQTKLIPRWLSGWGIIGVVLLLLMALSIMFGRDPSGTTLLLALPIALQEMILAVWLLVKGFNASAITRN